MGPEAEFNAYLDEGRFMIQRSKSTGKHVFYHRAAVPGSGERDLEWVEASGNGVVYSTTVNRRRPEKGGAFNVALIDLAEGPRMMSRVVDIAAEDVKIGMAVTTKIGEINGERCIVWSPK